MAAPWPAAGAQADHGRFALPLNITVPPAISLSMELTGVGVPLVAGRRPATDA
jgi:hypothetical protein